MSNRSYLYGLNFNPSEKKKDKTDIIGSLGECASTFPIAYQLLVSCESKLCNSIIWEYEHPIAIIGNFEKGKKRLFAFLDKVIESRLFDPKIILDKVDKTKEFLNDTSRQTKFVVLEAGEIFEFSDEPIENQAQQLFDEISDTEKLISEYFETLKEDKEERDDLLLRLQVTDNFFFKKILGRFGRERIAENQKALDNLEGHMLWWLGIGEWSNVLYFDFGKNAGESEFD